jgi:hypothetical protein
MAMNDGGAAAACSQLHLQKWMNEPSSILQPDLQNSTSHYELGFVSSLYHECQQLLSKLWKRSRSKDSRLRHIGASMHQFQESNTRFVLWGSGWRGARLDFCVDASTQLRDNVTELLSGVAKALLRRDKSL